MKNKYQIGSKSIRLMMIISIVAIAMVMTACGGSKSNTEESKPAGESKSVAVSLLDDAVSMSIDPKTVSVASGSNVVLDVTNKGTQVHNLKVDGGKSTADLPASGTAKLEVGKVDKTVVLYCTIEGHRAQGMEMTIEVE